MLNQKKFTYIDLFAGAGGLSEGFIREGFLPIAHVEKDVNGCATLKTRIAYHYLKENNLIDSYYSYLKSEISTEQLYDLIPKELIESVICVEMTEDNFDNTCQTINNNNNKIDLIIGGPPCQAYSIIGRARERDPLKKANDPRRFLYKLYINFLKKFNPNIFVFENVPGIKSLKDSDGIKFIDKMKIEFDIAGYEIQYELLDASDFGVLQRRQRIIIIGWKKELKLSYPDFDTVKLNNEDFLVSRDILSDLPKLQAGDAWNSNDYHSNPSSYLERYGVRNNKDLLTWHVARPTNENDKEIYRIAVQTWFNGKKRLQYNSLDSYLKKHKNQDTFLNRFCVVEGDQPFAHTLVAHISQDGHYYIHPDIEQNRSITVREAARIQSFPDDYFFEGSRSSAFKQIGNAVPPLLGSVIAKKIKEMLCNL